MIIKIRIKNLFISIRLILDNFIVKTLSSVSIAGSQHANTVNLTVLWAWNPRPQ